MRIVHRTLIALLASAAITVAGAGAAHATSLPSGLSADPSADRSASAGADESSAAIALAADASPRVLKSEIEGTPDGFSVGLEFQQELSGGWLGGAPLYVGAYEGTLKEFPADPSTLSAHGLGLYGALPSNHWGTEARAASLAQVPAPSSHYSPGSGRVAREFEADRSGPVTVLVWGFAGTMGSSSPVVVASAEILPSVTVVTPEVPELNGSVVIPRTEGVRYLDESGATLAAGPLERTGRITVTAVAEDGYEIPQGAAIVWSFDVPGTTPATPSPVPVVNEGDLGADFEGYIVGPGSAVAGGTVEIEIGVQYAGQTVHVFMFSEPTYLGEYLVDSAGFVRVKLAEGLVGVHRLAAYDVTGGLIGWQRVVIDGGNAVAGAAAGEAGIAKGATTSQQHQQSQQQTGGSALAATGSDDKLPVAAFGALLLVAGAAVSLGGRYRGARAAGGARHAAH